MKEVRLESTSTLPEERVSIWGEGRGAVVTRQCPDERSAGAWERLVAELLRLKGSSGLSYEGLAERTGYSRSSWQRFLNGGKLPTQAAVEQLADVTGGDRDRLLALWEYARSVDDDVLPETSDASAAPLPEADRAVCVSCRRPRSGIPSVVRWGAGALALVLVAGVTVLLTSWYMSGHASPDRAVASVVPSATPAPSAPEPPSTPQCHGASCEGQEPTAMGCGRDARTVRTTWLVGLVVTLRHSPGCGAAWARIDNGTVGYQVRVSTPDGRSRSAEITWGQDVYTRMLATDDPGAATACGVIPRHDEECTGKGSPPSAAP